MTTILYIHGFRSSGNSGTAQIIQRLLPNSKVIAPDLPVNALDAIDLLKSIIQKEKIDIVVGTSMGGMFAQKLHGIPKILVNPSFHVSETFRKNMGVVEYFKRRADGRKNFEITPEIVDSYIKIEENQFSDLSPDEIDKTFGIFGRYDDTVNCLSEYKNHYRNIIFFDGGHRLDQEGIKKCIIPIILNIERNVHR